MCAIGAAISLLNALPATAQTEGAPAISKAVEQCIRDNAPAVERAIDRLPDAVDFLVADVCAKPIAEQLAAEQEANVAQVREAWKKDCEQRKAASKSNGSDACPTHAEAFEFAAGAVGGWTLYASNLNKPADATSLAARLLLELRTQHLNATSTQGTH